MVRSSLRRILLDFLWVFEFGVLACDSFLFLLQLRIPYPGNDDDLLDYEMGR